MVLEGAVYAGFWNWYGANGDPLSQAEGLAMLNRVEQVHCMELEDAHAGSMSRNLGAVLLNDDGKEFYAINPEN